MHVMETGVRTSTHTHTQLRQTDMAYTTTMHRQLLDVSHNPPAMLGA